MYSRKATLHYSGRQGGGWVIGSNRFATQYLNISALLLQLINQINHFLMICTSRKYSDEIPCILVKTFVGKICSEVPFYSSSFFQISTIGMTSYQNLLPYLGAISSELPSCTFLTNDGGTFQVQPPPFLTILPDCRCSHISSQSSARSLPRSWHKLDHTQP